MQVGDLIQFSANAGFNADIAGKTALVVAIRPTSMLTSHPGWREWDCLIGRKLYAGFPYQPDDPDYLESYGVKILS